MHVLIKFIDGLGQVGEPLDETIAFFDDLFHKKDPLIHIRALFLSFNGLEVELFIELSYLEGEVVPSRPDFCTLGFEIEVLVKS